VTYLLDTHVWLWLLGTPERLPAELVARLRAADNRLLLSAASTWEIAIKWTVGRLPLPEPPGTYVPRLMAASGVSGLPIEHAHALHVATLPRNHDDPFDRLLIAQSQLESIPIVTADPAFEAYDIEVVSAA
jgi:PIN domain nuclease of toxin-antitoxin system